MARKKDVVQEEKPIIEESVNLISGEVYEIEIVKSSQHLTIGRKHKVSGNIAEILINKGLAKLC